MVHARKRKQVQEPQGRITLCLIGTKEASEVKAGRVYRNAVDEIGEHLNAVYFI